MRPVLAWFALLLLLAGCGGGGGGGGTGGGGTVALQGRVLWIVTGTAPDPVATVRAGATSTPTDPIDGFFELAVPVGTSSVSVTYAPPGQAVVVRSFSFPAVSANTDIGDLYIGPQTVTVEGRVADAGTDDPVPGASVTLAGQRATSAVDGRFSIANVAYSPDSETVFLGLQGTASATGYTPRSFNPPAGPLAGVVDVGTVALSPSGAIDPPPPPFNVRGRVLPAAQGAGAAVTVLQLGSVVRSTTADSDGRFQLWLAVGDYTVRAQKGAAVGEAPLRIDATNVIKNVDVTLP